jgi:hypothetical protein
MADGREFVTKFSALDAAAQAKGIPLITGASTVPGLSSAVNAFNSAPWNTSTSFGYKALNTAYGYSIVAIGAYAMQFNTHSGVWNAANTAIGAKSLLNGSDDFSSVALGKQALLRNTTGHYNIGIGVNALSIPGFFYSSPSTPPAYPVTGNSNVALGNNTGNTIGAGTDNILIGNNADVPLDTSHFLNVDNVIFATCAGSRFRAPRRDLQSD